MAYNPQPMKKLIVVLFLCAVASAQRTVIHAGKMFDAKSGKTLANQYIVVEGDKIVSVGPAAPAGGDKVIELANVLPGLIDVHTHLTGDPFHFGYVELSISTAREALNGAVNAKTTLEAGFTTVRNLGAGGYTDIALRDMINEGQLPGQRIDASGPPLGITGGHCDNNLLPFEYHNKADGVADCGAQGPAKV